VNILYLCAGTGSYYCGSCLRDLALVEGLRELGHTVEIISLYLPLFPEKEGECSRHPIFLGGVNIYLQEKFALFRALPSPIDQKLNSRAFLKRVAETWTHTEPRDLGPLTLSMLMGPQGRQNKEIERFMAWLQQQPAPDVICLSNILLLGLASSIRATVDAPLFCTMQGEEPFLDELPEPFATDSWSQLQKLALLPDKLISVSADYASRMRARLDISPDKIAVAHNGIDLSGFPSPPTKPPIPEHQPVIGFLARICAYKGAHKLVDAFIQLDAHLKEQGAALEPRLRLAGTVTQADAAFVRSLKAKVADAGLTDRVDFQANIDRAQKIRFLSSLSLCAVPAEETESFGLYVLEALACGVPVVMPNHAAFPEIIEQTQGGFLYDPNTDHGLRDALVQALQNPDTLRNAGDQGYEGVQRAFSAKHMAERVLEIFESLRPTPGSMDIPTEHHP